MIKIPGYSIVRPLGKGGMAEVYLAIQQSFEREVALKVLASNLAEDPSFTERFISEARIVSRLVHPNIVTVYDVGVEGRHHFLSMEYIPGLDLKQARYNLPLSRRLAVIKDIARALNFAGRKGYVHRDVKPDNIMLHAEDGRAVLMDFGIARPSGGLAGMTQTGTTLGTPHYMSPEQARGWGVDPRSDLYSLGVVLYLLLVGRVPFDADSAVAVGVQHVSEPAPKLPQELVVFQPVLDRVLAKNPEHRYQTGAEFVEALDTLPRAELNRLEFSLFKEGCDSTRSEGLGGPCSDSDPTMEVTVPTVKRLVFGGGERSEDGEKGYRSKGGRENTTKGRAAVETGYEDTPDGGYQGEFNRRFDDGILREEDKSKGSIWPWWVGAGIAACIGYAVYFQQQLPVEERLQPIAALEQRLPALAEGVIGEPPKEPVSEEGGRLLLGAGGEADLPAPAAGEPVAGPEAHRAVTLQDPSMIEKSSAMPESSATIQEPSAIQEPSTVQEPLAVKELPTSLSSSMAEEAPFLKAPVIPANALLEEKAETSASSVEESLSPEARSRQIEMLLAKAQRQHQLGDILMPVNANELYSLRQVLDLDSDNLQAKHAVNAIEESLIRTIDLHMQQQRWDDARAEIARARAYFPASKRLQVLKSRNEQAILAGSQPKIEKVLVSHKSLMGVDQPQEHFLPAMDELHVGFAYENFEPGAAVVHAHLFEADRSVELAQVTVPITRSNGEQFLSFARPKQTFADGVYRVDLTFNGQLLGSSVFEISHPPQL